MNPFGQNPYTPPSQPHDPYGQLSIQQQLQRQRQAIQEAYHKQIAEIEAEHARHMAKFQREMEVLHRQRAEIEAESKRLRESANLPGQPFSPGLSHPMLDGGFLNMLNALYIHPSLQVPSVPATGQRPLSSAPKATHTRSPAAKAKTKAPAATKENAVSDKGDKTAPATSPSDAPRGAAKTPETQQADTSSSRKAVAKILFKLSSLKCGFTFPATLDFLCVDSPTPKLAYTPNNAPLHQYEHLLTGLLTQLDAVESHGDMEVRKARKDAVRKIEKELGKLDEKKLREWRRQFESATRTVIVIEPTSDPTLDINTTQGASYSGKSTLRPQAPIDPASIPLPHDDDWELWMDDISERPATSPEPVQAFPAQGPRVDTSTSKVGVMAPAACECTICGRAQRRVSQG
ncbi:hypothetical protein FRC08_005889 [Ceratobasidium sp. 394]|nr:hypothetical protein FRC08_005889 [Ceratobasidium sp. 394]